MPQDHIRSEGGEAETEANDLALAPRLALGDAGAFAELLSRYWRPMVTFATGKLGSQEEAEDAVQESFVRVWEKRRHLRTFKSPRAYLYRVLQNLVTDEYRKRRVRERWSSARKREPVARTPSSDSQLETDELAAAARRAVAALPERRRDVFVLAHMHDLSYREIAEALQITPRTVANHMSLALKELRAALTPLTDAGLGPNR